ncbi:hypothetical protein ZOSMA_244G00070 [Zostera marina]|uniref:Uncharacterized protein n=1 Tax=Zostera marina TaxID=29655 RepID=A0A0K9PH01_ZOSMR|nr:hypothetical protein ZOSMA_244G00070 [Zostera marina]
MNRSGTVIILREGDHGVILMWMRNLTLGSREFLRYYRQKPPQFQANDVALAISLASRYKKMGLPTIQSKEEIAKRKFMKQKNRTQVDTMQCKIGMKNNIIRNIPKNLSH